MVILITWVFFRANNLDATVAYLGAMFSLKFSGVPFEFIDSINIESILALFWGVVLMTPLYRKIKFGSVEHWGVVKEDYSINFATAVLMLSLLGLSIIKLASGTHNPFIYFRF